MANRHSYGEGLKAGSSGSFNDGYCNCNTNVNDWLDKGYILSCSIVGTSAGYSAKNEWTTLTFTGKVYREENDTLSNLRGNNYIRFGPLYDAETSDDPSGWLVIDNSISSAQQVTLNSSSFSVNFNISNYSFGTSFKPAIKVWVKGDGTTFWNGVYAIHIEGTEYLPGAGKTNPAVAYDINFYEYYRPGCSIKFTNTGTTTINDMIVRDANNFTLPSAPSLTGYSFNGWLKNNTGNLQTAGSTQSSGDGDVDITYYGSWTKLYKVIFYNASGTAVKTYSSLTGGTVTAPTAPTRTGYVFKGWIKATSNQTYSSDQTLYAASSAVPVSNSMVNGSATAQGYEIKLYGSWQKNYQIKFDKVLSNATFSYTQNNYNNKIVGNTVPTPTPPTINTHRFIGWTRSLSSTNQNYWTSIPNVADDQVNGSATSYGYEIIYYAVWEARASIQLKENNTLQTSTTGTYGSFTITGAAATDNGTYYYNAGTQNIQVAYTLNSIGTLANPKGNQMYISGVATTSNLMTPNPDTNTNKAWTSKTWTATAGTSIIIDVSVARNLILDCQLVYYGIPGITNNNFSIGGTATQGVYSEIDSNNSLHKYYCLRPNEQVTFNTSCTSGNNGYYLAQFVYPKSTIYNNTTTWTVGTVLDSNSEFVSSTRTDLDSNQNPKIFNTNENPKITDSDLLVSQKSGSYTFTANNNHMSSNFNNPNILYVYVYYKPYFQSYEITNIGYSTLSDGVGNSYLTRDYCTTDKRTYLRILNETATANLPNLYFTRNNNTTKHVISQIQVQEYNEVDSEYQDENLPDMWYEIFNGGFCDYGEHVSLLTNSSGEVNLTNYEFNNYYFNRFIGYKINPESPYSEYHKPIKINVTWSDKDYKCFIVLQFIQSENSNATTDDVFDISDNSLNSWENFYLDDNQTLFIQEITNTNTTNSINAVFRDITNTGYILKEVEKYSFDGTYNSDCTSSTNHKIITREQLDTNLANLSTINITRESPYINPSDSTDTSNDKLTFNKTNLNNNPGVVDYYFITYEEGLPIFYPDDDNDPKRAIQMFWENNRVIGLYYGNTRLL